MTLSKKLVWMTLNVIFSVVEKVSYSTKKSHQNKSNFTKKKNYFLVKLDIFW